MSLLLLLNYILKTSPLLMEDLVKMCVCVSPGSRRCVRSSSRSWRSWGRRSRAPTWSRASSASSWAWSSSGSRCTPWRTSRPPSSSCRSVILGRVHLELTVANRTKKRSVPHWTSSGIPSPFSKLQFWWIQPWCVQATGVDLIYWMPRLYGTVCLIVSEWLRMLDWWLSAEPLYTH